MKENKLAKEKVMDMNKQENIRKYIRPIIVKSNQINKVCLQRIIRRRYTDLIVFGKQNAKLAADILGELGIETVIPGIDYENAQRTKSTIRKNEMLAYRVVITSRKRRHDKKNYKHILKNGAGVIWSVGDEGVGARKSSGTQAGNDNGVGTRKCKKPFKRR